MKLYILNGPNLNMLGKRNPDQYGRHTLAEINELLVDTFPDHDFNFYQSNSEGAIVGVIHELMNRSHDGLIANFGAYTHTSIAIRDALEMLPIPVVEVHLSNIHSRESFRHKTLTGAVSSGIIAGFGKHSYVLGVEALQRLVLNSNR
ncbi:MAG: type II 3-dehydroquinate dehydratase [Balneolaceae bacterium]|nr:type II 3-dehydroquinate dehydratase [Balneolaceae bacterium]